MATSIQEYLKRAEQDPTFAGKRETQNIRNALQAISSYQTSTAVGQALGVDAEAQPKKGILTRVLDDILGAPGRAIKAGVADVIGFDDPRLREQGVLGSAARGFTGDIRITGGDLIPTSPEDSLPARAAKLAGAFALDVGLDPITYIGTPAALGRKAASVQAAYSGGKIFKSAAAARSKATGETVEATERALRDDLFARSRQGQDMRRRLERGVSEEQIAKEMSELGGEAFRQTVAERQLGSIVGESLWAEGRQGIIGNLTELLSERGGLAPAAAREAAEEVFKSLGDRVRGGLFFVNPLTGREIARVTSGTGESFGALGVQLNKSRAWVATRAGRATNKLDISGEFGPAMQLIREDLSKYGAREVRARSMTLADYIGAKEMKRIETMATANLGRQFLNISSEATLLKQKLGMSDEKFNNLLMEGVLNPNAALDGAAAEVHAVGLKMAYGMKNMREQLIDSGVDVGDLGETYLPLAATKEGREFLDRSGNLVAARTAPVGATGAGTVAFKTERGRNHYFRAVDDIVDDVSSYGTVVGDQVALKPELANIAAVGEQMQSFGKNAGEVQLIREFFDGRIDLAARGQWSMADDVGKLADELRDAGIKLEPTRVETLDRVVLKPFETDMIKIMGNYWSGSAPRIARRQTIEAGLRSGVLQARDTATQVEMTDRVGRQWMLDYAETAGRLRQNPRIAQMIADGKLDGEMITATAMLDESNLARIIQGSQLDRSLPVTAQQAAAVEEALMNVANLHRVASVPEEQLAIIRQAADALESVDNVIAGLDGVVGELYDAGLNSSDIAELIESSQAAVADALVSDGARTARLFTTSPESVLSRRPVQTIGDETASLFGVERLGATADVEGVVSLPQELQEVRAIKGVRELIERRHEVQTNPSGMEKFFKDVYDPAFLTWKTGATVGRGPGYTFLNMVGNLYMNHLGGISVADHQLSGKVLQLARAAASEAAEQAKGRGLKVAAKDAPTVLAAETDVILRNKLEGLTYDGGISLYQALRDFIDVGGIDSSQVGEALSVIRRAGVQVTPEALGATAVTRTLFEEPAERGLTRGAQAVAEALINNPYQRTMNTVNTNVETWTRFAAYLDGYRGTQSIEAAMDRMYLLQFNYGDLAKGDRAIRRVLPFYVWTRNNVPAQIRAMFVQPGKIRRFMAAQDAFQQAVQADDEDAWLQQVLPDYIGEAGGFASRLKTPDGDSVAFAGKLPYHDVERLFQVGGRFGLITANRREIAQMFGPFTTALEMVFGRDFTTGGEFDPSGVEATGWRSALGAVPGLGQVGQYGERRIPRGLEKFTSELLPQVGTAERALTGVATGARMLGAPEGVARAIESPAGASMRERGLSNLLNVSGVSPLLGVSATTLTPRTISSSLRGRSRDQQAAINRAAGQLQVSADWVREELRKGFTPDELAVRIAQGEGRIEEYEAEQDARQRPPSQRYGTILEDLRRGSEVRSLGYGRRDQSPPPALFGGR